MRIKADLKNRSNLISEQDLSGQKFQVRMSGART
jgi:hypothetical protein